MSRIILLDAGPLGLVTNPRATTENHECNLWLQAQDLSDKGHSTLIATTNIKHLTLFVGASLWRDI